MSSHEHFTRHYTGCILMAVILALFAQVSISHGAGKLIVWPVSEGAMQSKSTAPSKSYEVRKGQVALAPELLPKPAGALDRQAGIAASKVDTDTVSINFFTDVTYEVKIDSVNYHADGTAVINGELKDHKIRTVVMTIGPEGFFITLEDMNRSLLYRVTGDSRQGSGTVTEIDMKKIPPMIR